MAGPFVNRASPTTIPITGVTRAAYKRWLKQQPARTRTWLQSIDFGATSGQRGLVPGKNGALGQVVLGLGEGETIWPYASAAEKLPPGRYRLAQDATVAVAHDAALGWGLGTYRFTRYKKSRRKDPSLVWPAQCDREAVGAALRAITLGRDLINTPAGDLGPAELAQAVRDLGAEHDAKVTVIRGDALLKAGYPAVHAVGRAAVKPPHLADLRWGRARATKLTLVGKGVCFDSGGLDLKSAAGMKLMKKDMGGAASVLALAHMVMAAGLDVRLRVLIPTVENAVSGDAYRPMDVLQTRKGLTVEVGNTDAEGRLILCDALAEADTEDPDLVIDFATLTGAARVALGTELPALFSSDDAVAEAITAAGLDTGDPLWRMPLHQPYRRYLDSAVADLNNISSVPQGGAITAALFLREFVDRRRRWVHIDTMGWNTGSRPGRPAGGEVFGVRAVFAALDERYGRA